MAGTTVHTGRENPGRFGHHPWRTLPEAHTDARKELEVSDARRLADVAYRIDELVAQGSGSFRTTGKIVAPLLHAQPWRDRPRHHQQPADASRRRRIEETPQVDSGCGRNGARCDSPAQRALGARSPYLAFHNRPKTFDDVIDTRPAAMARCRRKEHRLAFTLRSSEGLMTHDAPPGLEERPRHG